MKTFLRQAEDILDVAAAADGDAGNIAILIDNQGGMRMLDSMGWSLPALCAEYGARAVYRVERRALTVRVEGWGGGERCLIQRDLGSRRISGSPCGAGFNYPITMQRLLPDTERRTWAV